MITEIDEENFKDEAYYNTKSVSYLLEEMKTRLDDNVFLLNKITIDDLLVYEAPHIRKNGDILESSLGSYLAHVMSEPKIKQDKLLTIASVINVEENHYISAIFRKEGDVKTLVIHDPLGSEGKTSGYNNYVEKIEEEFSKIFGGNIDVEKNPKNNVLYQNDVKSCGPVCIANLEIALNNKILKEDPKLGITKDKNNEFRCKKNTSLLRAHQLKQLNHLKDEAELLNKFMEGNDSISSASLVNNIFTNTYYGEEVKNAMLNRLLDAGMIEGNTISKDEIIKALHNPKNPMVYSNVKKSDNFTPTPTPDRRREGPNNKGI